MNISRNERKELDALSKEVFGTSSRWQKLVNRGYVELVTEKVTETVPGENGEPDTTREVDAPKLRKDGAHQSVMKQHTVESIREAMLEGKAKIDEMKAKIAAMQAEQAAKQEADARAKALQESAGGSAV